MGKLQRFQQKEFVAWSGLTQETHLAKLFQMSPQKATPLMIELMATYRGHNLESMLSKLPVKEFDTDDEYTWEIIGSSRRNIGLIEARKLDGTVVTSASGMIGASVEPFYLVFPEDWFGDGEVIVGNKNELYPMLIKAPSKLEGTNAVVMVELMGGNETGIPAEELLLGAKFSWEYAPVERSFSREVGTVRYTAPIAMRNEFSQIRLTDKIGGNMLGRKLAIGIPFLDKQGKKSVSTMWMHHSQLKIEETFSDYKNNLLNYGRSNRNANGEYLNIGKSGQVIQMGAGLKEQCEYGNTMYVNSPTLKMIEDALMEISIGKLSPANSKVILKTGMRGATKFHKDVLNTVSGWQAFSFFGGNGNVNTVKSVPSPLHDNALSAGFQFVEYRSPNGVTLSIDIDPSKDDPIRNKIPHPEGGLASSYEYDILALGTPDTPNIQLARVKNRPDLRGYQWGLRNPYTGAMNNDNMSFSEDSASMHMMATLGVFVLDPTRTMSIKLNMLS